MKIAIDSNDLSAATRLDAWRGMLCDSYVGLDCHFPDDGFRSVIAGYAMGDHTITRIKSSRHFVDRSPTLIKRDGREIMYFGMLLAGRAATIQAGREAVLERGTVVVSDTSRPVRTYVDEAADILWLGVPKGPALQRFRGIEDIVATPLRPSRPVEQIAFGLMADFDTAPTHDRDAERLTARLLDLMAVGIAIEGLGRAPR